MVDQLRYEYDLAGRLTALIDGEGSRTEWSFDAAGRLVRKTYADGTHYDYTYLPAVPAPGAPATGAADGRRPGPPADPHRLRCRKP